MWFLWKILAVLSGSSMERGFEVGQQVKMKMFTNYTHDSIFDDEIEKVEIRG